MNGFLSEAMEKVADALDAVDQAPPSREASIAKTNLQQAMHWLRDANTPPSVDLGSVVREALSETPKTGA